MMTKYFSHHSYVTIPFKFPGLFLLFTKGFLLILILCYRLMFQDFFKFIHYTREHGGSKFNWGIFYRVLLRDSFIHLFQKDANLVQQLRTVLFNTLAPDKSIFVGFGLDLRAVDILHVKTDETFVGKNKNQLGEYMIYLLLYTVTKTVDRDNDDDLQWSELSMKVATSKNFVL